MKSRYFTEISIDVCSCRAEPVNEQVVGLGGNERTSTNEEVLSIEKLVLPSEAIKRRETFPIHAGNEYGPSPPVLRITLRIGPRLLLKQYTKPILSTQNRNNPRRESGTLT
jgi:hypothetical protein